MSYSSATAIPTAPASRLPPPKSFAEASALVEAALGELRAAEVALERQLSDLRGYMRKNVSAGRATTIVQ